MTSHLFVYGTLAPGRPNAHVLEAIGGTWTGASLRGHLHQDGWGAELGYPGLMLDETAPSVHGHLFSSASLPRHWDDLDAFEGDQYERVRAPVTTSTGDTVEAFVYVLRAS